MPLTPGGRIHQPGEDEVDDVLAQVVLAAGDEDLGAGHPESPVAGRLGPCAQQPEVGAAMRLREAHDAGPRAVDELRQVAPAQLVGAVLVERDAGAVGQSRVQREGHVGRLQHLLDEHTEGVGQSLTAELRIAGQSPPAAFDVGAVCVAEPGRGAHLSVVECAAFLVADPVEREHHVLAELRRLFEHRIDQVPRRFLESWQRRELLLCAEKLVQHELHVPERCLVRGHWSQSPIGRTGSSGVLRHPCAERLRSSGDLRSARYPGGRIPAGAGIHVGRCRDCIVEPWSGIEPRAGGARTPATADGGYMFG